MDIDNGIQIFQQGNEHYYLGNADTVTEEYDFIISLHKTVSSTFRSNYILVLKDYNGNFRLGEQVVQKINSIEVFRGTVVEWRFGSNLLKVANTTGIVRENISIESTLMPVSGTVQSIFVTTFDEEISSL